MWGGEYAGWGVAGWSMEMEARGQRATNSPRLRVGEEKQLDFPSLGAVLGTIQKFNSLV